MRVTSLAVLLAGASFLTRLALPLSWDGLVEQHPGGIVGSLLLAAVVGGGIAGLLVAAARLSPLVTNHARSMVVRALPSCLMVAISVVALWPYALLVAPFDPNDHTGNSSGRLVEAVAGWIGYVGLAHLLQAVLVRAGRADQSR